MTIALLEAGISEVDILSIMMDDRFGVSKAWKPQGIEYIEVKINEAVETLKTFAANPPKDQSSTYLLYPFVAFNEIKPSTTPAYLVKGIIPSEGQTTVWGKPKCGKSFWVFDLVMHIALGWSYRGRRVKQCAVAYMALEGGHGFKARIEAWRKTHLEGHAGPVPFYLCDKPMPAGLAASVEKLIGNIKATMGDATPGLIVLDTLNRSLAGSESSDEDMGNYIKAADQLREMFKCAVIIIHHCGLAEERPRGHTSLIGADDAQVGKSFAIAGLALYFSTAFDYSDRLAVGERALIPILASAQNQASKIFSYIRGMFQAVALFKPLLINETKDTLVTSNRVDIEVRTANFRTICGQTCPLAICDEIAYWYNENSANPDKEIIDALRPSLATLNGVLVAISSPYAKRGELWENFKRYSDGHDRTIVFANRNRHP